MEKEWEFSTDRKGKDILLAIKPKYAEKIFKGQKTVELRKAIPRIEKDSTIYLYVSSPVMAICGAFTVEEILTEHPQILWLIVEDNAGVSRLEFETYFESRNIGYGLRIDKTINFKPLSLAEIRAQNPNFSPPQNYRYIDAGDMNFEVCPLA